jgi:hypothetical protein
VQLAVQTAGSQLVKKKRTAQAVVHRLLRGLAAGLAPAGLAAGLAARLPAPVLLV